LLRWLVNEVPDQVTVTASAEPAALHQAVELQAELRDSSYRRINDAEVSASVLGPDGAATDLPLRWSSRRDGEYLASFLPQAGGAHRILVRAERGGHELATGSLVLDASEDDGEFYGAQLRTP